MTAWRHGDIDGVVVRAFQVFEDERGWLAELYRSDEIPPEQMPAMGYLSETRPGVARGPHEHREQTDMFAFFHGTYALYLWDAREESETHNVRSVLRVGSDRPCTVVIPPGVVHAYRNDSPDPAYVLNFPDRLYAGPGKKEPVDEIRHEDDGGSPYVLD